MVLNKIIKAFISSYTHHCTSFVGPDWSSLCHIQVVENGVARRLTWKKRCDHITSGPYTGFQSTSRSSLSFYYLFFRSHNSKAPPHMFELLQPHTSARALKSMNQFTQGHSKMLALEQRLSVLALTL